MDKPLQAESLLDSCEGGPPPLEVGDVMIVGMWTCC